MKVKFSIATIAAAMVIWFGNDYFFSHATEINHSPQNIKVVVTKVMAQNVPIQVKTIGTLSAKKAIDISPEIEGKIESILFQYGTKVKKGDLLYQLDSQLFQAQYSTAGSELHLSKLTYERNLRLMEKNIISKQSLDDAESEYNNKKHVLKELQIKLNKMAIKAPFSGIIGASQIDAGQYVDSGEALVKLFDNTSLIVKFSIPEQYFSQAAIDNKLIIYSDSLPEKQFSGKVSYIAPNIDTNTRTMAVWAEIENTDSILSPGLFVQVELVLGIKNDALFVPQTSLIPTIEGNDVFIVENGKAYKRSVKIAQMVGNTAEIVKGINVGDSVVTLGQEKLANGRNVELVSL